MEEVENTMSKRGKQYRAAFGKTKVYEVTCDRAVPTAELQRPHEPWFDEDEML